jgi:hypothetical protein
MNDREITKNADDHIMLADVLYRGTAADLGDERAAVDQCAIRIGVKESLAKLASNHTVSASSTDRT